MTTRKSIMHAAIATTALLTLTFNLNWRVKFGVALIGSLPGIVYGVTHYQRLKSHKGAVEELLEEQERIKRSHSQLEELMAERRHRLDEAANQIKEKQKDMEKLLELAKDEARLEKARIEALSEERLNELARLEQETRRDCDRVVADVQGELEQSKRQSKEQERRLLAQAQAEIAASRHQCAVRILEARRRWREQKETRQDEWRAAIAADSQQLRLDRKQLELDRQALQGEIELERSQLRNQKASVEESIKQLWKEFDTEKEAAIAEMTDQLLEENDQRLHEEMDRLNQELASKQGEYDKLIKDAEKQLKQKEKELEGFYKAKFDEWLVPHVIDINRLMEDVEDWKSRYQQVEEELAASRDIILPENPWSQHHKTMAYQLQVWMKGRGVLVNYYNSAIDSTKGTFTLYFQPWLSGSKAKKALEGILDGMMADWGLLNRPIIGEGFDSWYIQLTPLSFHSHGTAEGDTAAGLIPLSFNRIQATDPRLVEPDSLAAFSKDDRDRVMDRASADQRIEEMMNYRPPTLPKPGRYPVTDLELKTIDWLWNWRAIATRDDPNPLPNIREINELLRVAYGVSIGYATENRDRVTNETLRQRVHRVLSLLRIEARKPKNNRELN